MRVTFITDGFNLYHSLVDAYDESNGQPTKWLDLKSLCELYVHQISQDADLSEVYYFSALAKHLKQSNPGTVKRHERYIDCLEDSGVKVKLGRFKKKQIVHHADDCLVKLWRHEEKETDVAIALKTFAVLHNDEADAVVMFSGNSDMCPVVRTVQRVFGHKDVYSLFPYNRKSKDLDKLTDKSFKVNRSTYAKHQFDDPYVLEDGTEIDKPADW